MTPYITSSAMQRLLVVLLLLLGTSAVAQKQSLDEQLLSDLVIAKQKELQTRVLQNLAVTHIAPTNNLTYNVIYQTLRLLTTEKNKHVLGKKLLQLMGDYGLVFALSEHFAVQTRGIDGVERFEILNTKEKFDLNFRSLSTVANAKFGLEKDTGRQQQIEITINNHKTKEDAASSDFLRDYIYAVLCKNAFLNEKGFFAGEWHESFFSVAHSTNYEAAKKQFMGKDSALLHEIETFFGGFNAESIALYEELTWLIELNEPWDDIMLDWNSGHFVLPKKQFLWLKKAFENGIQPFNESSGGNHFIYVLGTALLDHLIPYTVANQGDSLIGLHIDASAVIISLANRYMNKDWAPISKYKLGFGPLFTVGMNHCVSLNTSATYNFGGVQNAIPNFSFIGEKIGVRFTLADYSYKRRHKPMEWYKYRGKFHRYTAPQKMPFVSACHVNFYGSGLLYNLVNVKTEQNFNYALTGTGVSAQFFNGLQIGLSVAMPIISNENFSELRAKSFFCVSLDIPVIEYWQAAVKGKD